MFKIFILQKIFHLPKNSEPLLTILFGFFKLTILNIKNIHFLFDKLRVILSGRWSEAIGSSITFISITFQPCLG